MTQADRRTGIGCCDRCGRQRRCTVLDNGAALCKQCLAVMARLW